MGGFSNGDLVWCKKQDTIMWPALVVEATYPEDAAKTLVAFITNGRQDIDDIRNSRRFIRERSSLQLFDPRSASKFAPDPGTMLRKHFDEVISLATQLYKERKRKIQEEYQLLIEKATKRSSESDDDDSNAIELAAGAHVFFWIPGMIAGREEAEMYARVLTVYHRSRYEQSQIPLELDSGHVLTFDDSIKMLEPVKTRLMPLRKFKLKTSSVNGVRFADAVRQSVQDHIDNLKAENPAFASFFRDPFGSTRKEIEIGRQEAKDLDYAPTKKKNRKKSDPPPKKEKTTKRYENPRERAGWRPECDDSEVEEDNKMNFLPQLSVRNRTQSQSTPSRSSDKASLTPIRPKMRPVISDSDNDVPGDNVKGNRDQSQTQKLKCSSAKASLNPFHLQNQPVVSDNDRHSPDGRCRAKNVKTATFSKQKRRKSDENGTSTKNSIKSYFQPKPKADDAVSSPHLKRSKEIEIRHLDPAQSAFQEDPDERDSKDQNRGISRLNSVKYVQNLDESDSDGMSNVPVKSRIEAKKSSGVKRRRNKDSPCDSELIPAAVNN